MYAKHGFPPPLKYWVRPLVRWMSPETLYRTLSVTIPAAFEVKKAVRKVPGIGGPISKLIPIGPLSHAPRLNYTEAELKQVKILSAFDMFSPRYDQPQRMEDVHAWFAEAGLAEIQICYGPNGIIAKGRKPGPADADPP